ncbi:transcription factor [Ganoderma sinense ZZ0214-1]|uniref:Transcription factor n=1 Tax=Ganoderma sinense ZZ0214-1 TaxID=1077348 RepID=A0A2G8S8S1_9APHY|nr:transcription factor [Ganoderma sinense ZZ0214-1]
MVRDTASAECFRGRALTLVGQVFVNDKKFACESCIKGHRSSGCQHTDRPLFEVKKKGRPVSQCDKCRELRKTKRMHGKCTCSTTPAAGTSAEVKIAGPSGQPESKGKSRRFKPIAPALPNGLKGVLPAPDVGTDGTLNLCRCGGKDATVCTCGHERGPSMSMRQPDNGGLAALAHAALFCCADDLPSTSASTSSMPSNTLKPLSTAAPTHGASRKHTRSSCCSSAANSRPPSPKAKRPKPSASAAAASLAHSHEQHLPHALNCCSISSPSAHMASSSAPPIFPAIHPHSASAPVTENGCCCGVQCACPGCVQHRGEEHAAKDMGDCEDGECRTCVDHDGGIALPEHALAFSQGRYAATSTISNPTSASAFKSAAVPAPPLLSPSSSSGSAHGRPQGASTSTSYIDAFFATAASLPAPPPGRSMGSLDPTSVLVYPRGIFVNGDAGRRSLFGLVEVPKLQCSCPGGLDIMVQPEFKSGSVVKELQDTLRDEVDRMDESALRTLLHEAMKVTASLQYAVNSRRPIFTLPTELFNHIMEDIMPTTVPIGSSKIAQFWRPLFRDSTALIPLSQTCRHFRQISLAHPEWWTTLASQRIRDFSICTANSWPMSFNVVAFPEDATDVFRVFNDSTAARLEEVHAVRCNQAVMLGVRNLFSTDNRAPALKSLTCISTLEDRVHPFTLDPERIWALKHLVLDRAEFWFYGQIPYQIPSITHLILAGSSAIHRNIAQLISSCPNLQTLVLSELFSRADGVVPNTPFPVSNRIRRVVLHDLRHSAIEFYLALIRPRADGRLALQILNEQVHHSQFAYEPLIEQCLAGKATHLRIGVFTDTASFYRFSVTLASRANALRFASTASNLAASRYGRPDLWLARLLHPDVTDSSDVREAWLFNTTAPFTVYLTTFQTAVRSAVSALSALETLTLVTVDHPADGPPGTVLWPDISVVPTTDGSEWGCHRLKTLRMVHYDALPPRAQGDPNVFRFARAGIKLEFTRMLEQLALGGYGYLERLVVQASPRFEIDEGEVGALRAHFKEVVVERILELPRMWLPPVCVGADDGPGGRDAWTTTHY